MIFQAGIELKIEGKKVQAVVDFDTGIIGFTEQLSATKNKELSYFGAPMEYKKALIDALSPSFAEKTNHNLAICRKSEVAEVLRTFWSKQTEGL